MSSLCCAISSEVTLTIIYHLICALGYFAIFYFVIWPLIKSVFNCVFPFFYAAPRNLQALAGAKWAVITGSTDGIGKAYAFELAKKGFDLVLISRSHKKLNDTKLEISQRYSDRQIKTIAFDFTSSKLADYETIIFSELSQIDVGILVNNVGMGPERFDLLHTLTLRRLADLTIVNSLPAALLSAFILKKMSNRGSGIIVNIGSAIGYTTFPNWNAYAASKLWIIHLSEILRKEYKTFGITVQVVAPLVVSTKMTNSPQLSFFRPTAKSFARQAVRTIGLTSETAGCFAHQLQTEGMRLLPAFLIARFAPNVMPNEPDVKEK